MDSDIQAFVFGFLLPGVVSFVCLALATRTATRRPRSILGALVFSTIPCWYFSLNPGPLKITEQWHWLLWLGLFACLITVAANNKWTLWIFYSLFVLLATWLLVPNFERLADERAYWLAVYPLILIVSLDSSILLSHRLVGPFLPCSFLLATLAAALLVFCASIGTFAQLGGVLAGVIAGCCLASLCFPSKSLTSAIAPGWAVLYPGLLLSKPDYTPGARFLWSVLSSYFALLSRFG